ncbi:hypothetical protein FJ657_06720 [Schumannella soli]|uniref:Uncharacterized protein n=1 Tax=Schumannella soli TaxID=2590779 RepID=A0A506XS61_9MICO|nr:hypothetical protein FJ657_06720 [Schumannella soli]
MLGNFKGRKVLRRLEVGVDTNLFGRTQNDEGSSITVEPLALKCGALTDVAEGRESRHEDRSL